MKITDVNLDESNITFSLAGDISLGALPVIHLLIRRSQSLGLSVKLEVSRIVDADPEVDRHLAAWQQEGVTLCGNRDLRVGVDTAKASAVTLAEFLKRREETTVTARLNDVYTPQTARLDSELHRAQLKSLPMQEFEGPQIKPASKPRAPRRPSAPDALSPSS